MGFNLVSLQRLKDTFAKLSKKQQRIFDEMQSLLDPIRSFKAYREVLQGSASPLIPYMYVLSFTILLARKLALSLLTDRKLVGSI